MGVKQYTGVILKELTDNLEQVDDEQMDGLIREIRQANHIFTAGVGRSGFSVKAFTNRLMHLGFSVSNVGEITAPHTKAGDLLLIASGSGETDSLVSMARKAKKSNVRIALVTTNPESSIGRMADIVVTLPGVSPKVEGAGAVSVQPMGSAFEQMCYLAYDGMVLELMDLMNESSDTMYARHANLE